MLLSEMNYHNLDDSGLLDLVREENEEAFAEIYNRYWKRIYTLAFSYLKSPEAAEDLVHDVFIKIWTNKYNLVEVRNFKPYLFAIGRNLIISSLRNKVFHVTLDADEPIAEESFFPEKQISYRESVELLQKAIALLPPQQQQAFKLSRDEKMRYEEIARAMGISPLTVRNHLSKALGFIRKYLTDNGIQPTGLIIFLVWKNF